MAVDFRYALSGQEGRRVDSNPGLCYLLDKHHISLEPKVSAEFWFKSLWCNTLRSTSRIHLACLTFVYSNHIASTVVLCHAKRLIPYDRWAGPPIFQRMVQLMFFLAGNLHVRLQVMALLLP